MKPLRLAIAGLTACSGCQLSILNCEDELPEMLEHFDFSFFPMACSPVELSGKYDVSLVEGCISTPHEKEFLLELRKRSFNLIALGTCAVWGGVAALKNNENREMLRQQVYGDSMIAAETFNPTALHEIVQVDAVITGCPPEKDELIRLFAGMIRGALPLAIDYPVCYECHLRENLCLLTERDALCLGPVTLGGCNARCPSMSVSCEGCRGPLPENNINEFFKIMDQKGFDKNTVLGRLHRFCPEWK